MSAIDRFLEELARELPVWSRRRVVAEAEDHLREAAAAVGEDQALARFGAAADVARGFGRLYAARRAAVAILAALTLPFLGYPIVENALPPAPWPSEEAMPAHLRWKLDAIVLLYVLAVALGVVMATVVRRAGTALSVTCVLAVGTLVVATGLATVLSVQWAEAVPGTPGWIPAVALAELAAALGSATLLVRAARAGPA